MVCTMLYPPAKKEGTHCTREGWLGLQADWKGTENLVLAGIQSLDRPACGESL